MQIYLWWWILALVLVGFELTTGTFYLLVYGIAALAAGLVAWLGASLVVQLIVAALVASAGTLALRHWQRSTAHPERYAQDLDVGRPVQAESWADGRGTVNYRGALWDAEAESPEVDGSRPLYIRAVRGTTLILGN
jgi:membrane protein implicated in regulation of membrane protease activity